MDSLKYPTPKKVIEVNKIVLDKIKVKKADKPEVASYSAIVESIDKCRQNKGDIYDKAVSLLKNLIQKHPFESGNRRTAFVVTEYFLINNKSDIKFRGTPKEANIFKGVREGYYSDQEIKDWIMKGEIREFKRQ